MAVFVATVKDVFPGDLAAYEWRWQKTYRRKLSEDRPPSVERLRNFILNLWPRLFSPVETERIKAAASVEEIESAVSRFWLTPRRVRLAIEEPFAGPRHGIFVVYTGLGGGDCGVNFKIGERWFVDASLDDAGRWVARQCFVTLPVDKASAVLATLRRKLP